MTPRNDAAPKPWLTLRILTDAVPVQIEGEIWCGYSFFYRARHGRFRIEVEGDALLAIDFPCSCNEDLGLAMTRIEMFWTSFQLDTTTQTFEPRLLRPPLPVDALNPYEYQKLHGMASQHIWKPRS